jgi:hypothetical protein
VSPVRLTEVEIEDLARPTLARAHSDIVTALGVIGAALAGGEGWRQRKRFAGLRAAIKLLRTATRALKTLIESEDGRGHLG